MQTPRIEVSPVRHLALFTTLTLCVGVASGCEKGEQKKADDKAAKTDDKTDAKTDEQAVTPEAVAASSGCTVDFTSDIVNGSSLWADIPDASSPANCNFHRFAYNNFLYMVGGGDTPRFMTDLASTHILAKTGTWPSESAKLVTRAIRNVPSSEFEDGQAGDGFQLVDVGDQTVLYDIRINQTMWSSISANSWNTSTGLQTAATAYGQNSQTGGIWLPPNDTGDPSIQAPSGDDSIEIKTSWRNYGTNAADCPSSIMFCMEDSDGNYLGLLGMHFVQKTPTRGEWVWGSFEHVANSPDCSPTFGSGASSNPLQQNPRDPTNPSATINVNTGDLASQTGWSAFNFSSYGGDGTTCEFSTGTPTGATACSNPTGTSQCNGNPNPSGDGTTFVQTNVCRTDTIPDHSTADAVAAVCASTKNADENLENGNNVACITQSVLDNWPNGLDPRWKYYMPIGTEWLNATSVQKVGCVNMTNTATSTDSFACANPTAQNTFPTTGSVHLANTTMETWMQMGTCIGFELNGKPATVGASDCFTCHQPTTSTSHGDFSHSFSAFGG